MGEKIPGITAEQVKAQCDTELETERSYFEKQREVRMAAIESYFRQPLGNEVNGRSKAQSSDVMESVEWVMPYVLRQVMASDDKIQVKGPDHKVGKALKIYARQQIDDQGGFRFFYDWCKDALIGDNGFVKIWWKRTFGESEEGFFQNVPQQELDILMKDPEYEIHDITHAGEVIQHPTPDDIVAAAQQGLPSPEPMEVPVFAVQYTYTPILESMPVYENIPSYEIICGPEKRRINDDIAISHRVWKEFGELERLNEELSEPGEDSFFEGLDRIPDFKQSDDTQEDAEKQRVEQIHTYEPDWQDYGPPKEGAKRKVEFIERYQTLDVKGKLVPAVVFLANGWPIRWEKNDEGVNMCTWSPMLNPHHLYGVSYATLVRDIQNIKTMMTRALLDSVGYSVDKAWLVNSATGVDLYGLQRLRPGKVVTGVDPNNVQAVEIQPLDARLFAVLDYMDVGKEHRTGGFKPAQGQPDSSAKTASGTQMLQQASFSRIDLVVLIFAEVGFRDLYQKTVNLIQKNLDKPIPVTVDGETVVLTPDNIQGDYKARSSMGIVVDFNEAEYNRLNLILDKVLALYDVFPMLFPLKKIYSLLRRVFAAGGFKEQDELMSPPPIAFENWFMGMENIDPKLLQRPGEEPLSSSGMNQVQEGGTSTPEEQVAQGAVTEGGTY